MWWAKLIRDQVAGSQLTGTGLVEKIDRSSAAASRITPCSNASSPSTRSKRSFTSPQQTIVGVANRSPLSTFEANIKGTWCLLEAGAAVRGTRLR